MKTDQIKGTKLTQSQQTEVVQIDLLAHHYKERQAVVVIHGWSLSALQNPETSDMTLNQDVVGMVDGVAYCAYPKTASHASEMRLVSRRDHL